MAASLTEAPKVWAELLHRQLPAGTLYGCSEFTRGLETIGFRPGHLPQPEEINDILHPLTGWTVVPVSGIVEDEAFFHYLSGRKFPVTWWIRNEEQLDYLEEPDLFHDLFGHIPLLTDQAFCDFLEGLGWVAKVFPGNAQAIHLLSRFYWYTVEFGLIRQQGELRIFGAGILSSPGEVRHSLSRLPMHFEFNAEQILHTPYVKNEFQQRYFIVDSLEDLEQSLQEIEVAITACLAKRRTCRAV